MARHHHPRVKTRLPLRVLRARREFLAIAKGDTEVARGLVLQALPRTQNHKTDTAFDGVGFGLTATKKIGNAVIRNRTRRRLRALAHEILPKAGRAGYDYVLIARYTTASRKFNALRQDLHAVLRRVHKEKRAG